MKPWIVLLCLSLACLGAQAKAAVWQPAAGHTQLPLWPARCPMRNRCRGRKQ